MNTLAIQLLSKFTELKKEQLMSLAEQMDIIIPLKELMLCQTHFSTIEKRQPTADELYLLDGIVRRRAGQLASAELSEVDISDSYILHTYYDMLNKQTAIHGKTAPAPGLVSTLRLGSAYLAKRNIFPAGGVKSSGDDRDSELRICDSHGNTVCYREIHTPTVRGGSFKTGICFVLLWSPKEISPQRYSDTVDSLMADERITTLDHTTLNVGNYGIAASFVGKCTGVFIDPSRLPFNPSVVLHSAFCGCVMLCVAKEDVEAVAQVAAEYSLNATYFAKTTATGRLVTAPISDGGMPPINLSLPLLKALIDGRQSAYFCLPTEDFAAVCPHEPLYVAGSDTPINSAVHCAGVTLYPVKTVMDKNYFSEALNTALDSLLGIIATGAPLGNATMTLGIHLPENTSDSKGNGKALAMMLGAYRAIMALGVPEVNSSVEFGKEPTSLAVTAFARTQITPCTKIAPQNTSSLYYLGFARNEDMTPNLESFKQMWSFISDRFSAEVVMSAAPAVGSLAQTISSMLSGDIRVTLTEEGKRLNQSYVQGVIIQTRVELNIPKVGIISTEEASKTAE